MKRATFRFYAELNDHLAAADRFRAVEKEFTVPSTVKDMIESCGVPHTEVELIVVGGKSVDFGRLVQDGERVAVYPVFEALDVTPELRVRLRALREPLFVLDVHLGKLAGYLRMLGFDALYSNRAADGELVRISAEQKRILLTRDRGVLKHTAVTHGYWLRSTDSRRQTEEVVKRFDLAQALRPFTRCMVCNEPVQDVEGAQLPSVTASQRELPALRRCTGCGRIYWQGSHYRRMMQWIEHLARPRTP